MQVVVDSWAWLPTGALGPEKVASLKEKLTVTPKHFKDYQPEPPDPIALFREEKDRIGIPREYFLTNKKDQHDIDFRYSGSCPDGWPGIVFSENEALEPNQQQGVETICKLFREGMSGGVLQGDCGYGKTVVALGVAAELNVPTLVTVHKEFLMNQWKARIKRFLPKAKVGIVQRDRCEFEDCQISIGMNDSLISREYPDRFYKHFGLLIGDEVHRAGAPTWSRIPPMFPARWRLGVTATPRRADAAEKVFLFQYGPIIFRGHIERIAPKIKRVYTNTYMPKSPYFNTGLAKRPIIVNILVRIKKRNEIIVDQIVRAAQAGRKILVLSERRDTHLPVLHKMIDAAWPTTGNALTVDYMVGGRSEEELIKAEEAQIVLATSQYAKEGLDIPPLDTLVLATPMGDVEQAVGRIQRDYPGKKDPVVVDIRDDEIGLCKGLGEARERFYARKQWL